MERQRLSRFSTDPVLNAVGKPVVCEETPWLIRQLEAMARYPFIDSPWLAAVTGADAESITKSFKIAKREPNLYVKIAEYQLKYQKLHLHSRLVWQPAFRAEALLRKRGIEVNHEEFSGPAEHRLGSCQIRASFEIGATDNVSIIPWTTINDGKTSPYLPTGSYRGKTQIRMRADCNPFIINIEGTQRKRYFFPGFEYDRDTETLHARIKQKYDNYLNILDKKLYVEHLQFPRLYVPFVTVSQLRMKGMQKLWAEMAPDKFRDKALFKVFKDEPGGWALTEPWQTADGELVYLNQC